MRKVAVGCIGAGAFVRGQHLPNALRIPEIEVAAIADLNSRVLEELSGEIPLRYTTTDYHRILADPGIDMVIIGTRHEVHAELIQESLVAGKWVLCEKPMAQNEAEAAAIIAAEKKSSGRLAVGFNRRFAPAYRLARELMRPVRAPWFINYRIVNQNSHALADSSYSHESRMLYEGCHILDLAQYFLDADPIRVYMTGDRYLNNCCILSFADGSQFQILCASVGAVAYWKENMEIFAADKTIGIQDFIDMRIRGFEGEADRLFAPHLGEQAAAVAKYGFEFYEQYVVARANEYIPEEYRVDWAAMGISNPPIRRPLPPAFRLDDFHRANQRMRFFSADKGWLQSLQHFARCFLSGTKPENADALAGAKVTEMTFALLHSLETGETVDLREWYRRKGWESR